MFPYNFSCRHVCTLIHLFTLCTMSSLNPNTCTLNSELYSHPTQENTPPPTPTSSLLWQPLAQRDHNIVNITLCLPPSHPPPLLKAWYHLISSAPNKLKPHQVSHSPAYITFSRSHTFLKSFFNCPLSLFYSFAVVIGMRQYVTRFCNV